MLIDIEVDKKGFLNGLALAGKNMDFAESLALNRTANIVRDRLKKLMTEKLDRPTPKTLASNLVVYSKKTDKEKSVLIFINDGQRGRTDAAKGTAPVKYLSPLIEGGPRNVKRTETALKMNPLLFTKSQSNKTHVAPSTKIPRDPFGNLPKGQYTKILSDMRAGVEGNRAYKKRGAYKGRASYYIRPGSPVVFLRAGRVVIPALVAIKAPNYKKILPWYETVEKTWDDNIQEQTEIAIYEAITKGFEKQVFTGSLMEK